MAMVIRELRTEEFPPLLSEIADPPKKLFAVGELPKPGNICLTVVGSRSYTSYGKDVCEYLLKGLRGYPITIISGLALGMDSLAHQAALTYGLQTIGVPGSGLDEKVLYPRSNYALAKEIIRAGGGLLSEFSREERAALWTFPQRNRIMAGMSQAVLIVEAKEKSGSLITARLTAEYNRDLFIVPGSIFSPQSKGCHQFMKLGATPITTPEELLENLGFAPQAERGTVQKIPEDCTKEEREILSLLEEGLTRDEVIQRLSIEAAKANALLSLLELRGLIKENGGVLVRR